jgi:hypothetical protein
MKDELGIFRDLIAKAADSDEAKRAQEDRVVKTREAASIGRANLNKRLAGIKMTASIVSAMATQAKVENDVVGIRSIALGFAEIITGLLEAMSAISENEQRMLDSIEATMDRYVETGVLPVTVVTEDQRTTNSEDSSKG